MGAVTYPNEAVGEIIRDNFIPVQINIVDRPEFTDRFLSRWTPTIIFIDPDGRDHRRQSGYTPPEHFVADLMMGMAQVAFNLKRYEEAITLYERVVDEFPNSFAAPEALYMVGVSRYRATDDGSNLDTYWDQVMERYPGSRWAFAGDI